MSIRKVKGQIDTRSFTHILDKHGDSMQRSSNFAIYPLFVQTLSNIKGIGVGLDDTLQIRIDLPLTSVYVVCTCCRVLSTNLLNPLQTKFGICNRSQITRGKEMLQFIYSDFVKVSVFVLGQAEDGRHVLLRHLYPMWNDDKVVVRFCWSRPPKRGKAVHHVTWSQPSNRDVKRFSQPETCSLQLVASNYNATGWDRDDQNLLKSEVAISKLKHLKRS